MDPNVSACDDFREFACGRWLQNHPLPADRSAWSLRRHLEFKTRDRIRQLIQTQPHPTQISSFAWKTKYFYESCMAMDNIETAKEVMLTSHISSLGGWNVLREFQVHSFDLRHTFTRLHSEFGVSLFFKVDVVPDPRSPQDYVVQDGGGIFGTDFAKDGDGIFGTDFAKDGGGIFGTDFAKDGGGIFGTDFAKDGVVFRSVLHEHLSGKRNNSLPLIFVKICQYEVYFRARLDNSSLSARCRVCSPWTKSPRQHLSEYHPKTKRALIGLEPWQWEDRAMLRACSGSRLTCAERDRR
ncbi:hypothetical protein J6590_018761 [Homalodisca vitripennis]|nr:hypothetical protein J6590_018761 [Homalodisca vitripennis]